jgi:hypothetical protein
MRDAIARRSMLRSVSVGRRVKERAAPDHPMGRFTPAKRALLKELFTSARLPRPNLRILTAASQYSKPEQNINTI